LLLVLACVLTAIATAVVLSRAEQTKQLDGEIVAAQLRSLLHDSPIQVASSDSRTVKPWFTA
jgi:anti-sigma factor RsiW